MQHGEKKGGTQWGGEAIRSKVFIELSIYSPPAPHYGHGQNPICVCVCVCLCVCVSVVKRSVSACKTDTRLLTERQSKAAERCSFVLS